MFLRLLGNPLSISKGQSFVHSCTSKLQFSARRSSAAKQLSVGPAEIPVEGWIQDGVKGWVKIAQPQDHRVKCIGGVCLFLYAHACEEGEVREPADDKGPQNSCQGHCSFVLSGYGSSWCCACKWWSGSTNTPYLKGSVKRRLESQKTQ